MCRPGNFESGREKQYCLKVIFHQGQQGQRSSARIRLTSSRSGHGIIPALVSMTPDPRLASAIAAASYPAAKNASIAPAPTDASKAASNVPEANVAQGSASNGLADSDGWSPPQHLAPVHLQADP